MSDAARRAQAERFGDYFELQIGFAELMAARTGLSLEEALGRYTNLRRRFAAPDENDPRWRGFLEAARTARDAAERRRIAQAVYAASPEEPLGAGQTGFGCFACEAVGEDGVVRLHFHSKDPQGPIARDRMAARRAEMREMFAFLLRTAPHARRVQGRSWLYHLEAYRRLYPAAYADSRRPAEGPMRLNGSSTWGQFIDRDGRVKADLRARFLAGLDRLDVERPWLAFPLQPLAVEAPIAAFHALLELPAPEDPPERIAKP